MDQLLGSPGFSVYRSANPKHVPSAYRVEAWSKYSPVYVDVDSLFLWSRPRYSLCHYVGCKLTTHDVAEVFRFDGEPMEIARQLMADGFVQGALGVHIRMDDNKQYVFTPFNWPDGAIATDGTPGI